LLAIPYAQLNQNDFTQTDNHQPEGFTIDDIAEELLQLYCAYIRNFVVARHASTSQGKKKYFRIDAATCRVDSSLTDTGAGPSIV
jgi:hypothetical protein